MSWTAKCTNEWVLEKDGVCRSLLEPTKKRNLTYFGHTMRKHDSLEKDIIMGTLNIQTGKRQAEDIMDEQHYCMDWANVKCHFEEDRG